MEIGLGVMTLSMGAWRMLSLAVMARRKSPSVKMPRSLSASSTIATAPSRAFVIARSASRTLVPGWTEAQCSPVRMQSLTVRVIVRPMAPAGWFMA